MYVYMSIYTYIISVLFTFLSQCTRALRQKEKRTHMFTLHHGATYRLMASHILAHNCTLRICEFQLNILKLSIKPTLPHKPLPFPPNISAGYLGPVHKKYETRNGRRNGNQNTEWSKFRFLFKTSRLESQSRQRLLESQSRYTNPSPPFFRNPYESSTLRFDNSGFPFPFRRLLHDSSFRAVLPMDRS